MITEAKPITREEQRQLDAEFGMRINRETRANPNSPYAGKYVVVANCEVVTVADSLDEMRANILALGLNPRESFYVEASANYDEPIWMSPRVELR